MSLPCCFRASRVGCVLLLLVSTVGATVLLGQSTPLAPTNLRIVRDTSQPPPPPPPGSGPLGDWPTAGANIRRTSMSPASVSTVTSVAWYRPIEAFINGSTQLVTAAGRVYVATAKGLIVLNAEDGSLACRFDTELPVATPTVDGGAVYVPGFDRTLYSLSASTCALNWAFTGAEAGFSGTPVVVDGRVFVGSRDGWFYAIDAQSGALAWSYATGGPVMQSAAYDGGVLYFASMDMYGYALNASTGALVWKTPRKLPGEQYTTWWPVVHGEHLVWPGATAYKSLSSPGALDVGPSGVDFNAFFGTPSGSITAGTVITSSDGSHGWPAGSTVMSTVTGPGPHTLQGWADAFPDRRVYAFVSRTTGIEAFHLPMLESGQNEEGQMHPPVSDGAALYFDGPFSRQSGNIPRARPMAWKAGTSWLRMAGATTYAADEPLILSMAGGRLYANLCCDREARVQEPVGTAFWHYSNMLNVVLPSQDRAGAYDPMWAFYDGEQFLQRLGGYYRGNTASRNGVYHNHGMQNPLVPLAFTNAAGQRVERLFTHRSNTVIALGPTATKTALPLIPIGSSARPARTLTATDLQARLESEVRKMVDLYALRGEAGFLRPAYTSDGGDIGNSIIMPEPSSYFRSPADTLYTLSAAYPYLSQTLRPQVLAYLAAYWQRNFVRSPVRLVGWNSGAAREAMDYPPEVLARMAQLGDVTGGVMPQRVFYAAWKYAQLVPSQAASIYATVRPLLVYPPPATLDLVRGPAHYNDHIAGYRGFLNLYDLAGTNPDPSLRATINNHLTELINTRINGFAKDHPWEGSVDNPNGIAINNYVRRFNSTRNFLYMTPDLGLAMRTSARAQAINTALAEYQYVTPHWFIARDQNTFQEGSAHHIFDSHALFLSKAYVAGETQAELSKWIDVPWMLGDLYYIQNVVAALQAGSGS